MKQKALLIIQNLSKSGSPLTFLHIIYALSDKYDIDVAVARVNNPSIDLEYYDEYKKNVDNIFIFNIKSYTLFNRAFPFIAYGPLAKLANNSKYSFVITNIFEVGALLNKKHIVPKVFFYSLDKLNLDSKYRLVNRRKRKMFDYLGKSDCFIALTSNCFYDWFDFKKINHDILLDYPDIEQKTSEKNFHTDRIVLGTIGYYCEKKNQLFSLKILKELIGSGVDASLELMGYCFENDRSYYEQMIDYIEENNLQEKVVFRDKNYDKKAYFDGIDVLLCPSLFEGLGLVILEAQYRKTPCLASDVLPRESQLGLVSFCSLDDTSAWINNIKSVVKSPRRVEFNSNLKSVFDFKILEIVSKYL